MSDCLIRIFFVVVEKTYLTQSLFLRYFWRRYCEGFTQKYAVHHLVWYEVHREVAEAIQREKQMKKWRRQWKINLIEQENPDWKDLYDDLL